LIVYAEDGAELLERAGVSGRVSLASEPLTELLTLTDVFRRWRRHPSRRAGPAACCRVGGFVERPSLDGQQPGARPHQRADDRGRVVAGSSTPVGPARGRWFAVGAPGLGQQFSGPEGRDPDFFCRADFCRARRQSKYSRTQDRVDGAALGHDASVSYMLPYSSSVTCSPHVISGPSWPPPRPSHMAR